MAIYKKMTEVYQIIPRILLHVILGITGKPRIRSERSWRSHKPFRAQRLPVGEPQQSRASDTGFSDKFINHAMTHMWHELRVRMEPMMLLRCSVSLIVNFTHE